MHYFSDLFGKQLYMFRTDLLSIIRSLNTSHMTSWPTPKISTDWQTSNTKFNRNLSSRHVTTSFCVYFPYFVQRTHKIYRNLNPLVKTRDKNVTHTCSNIERVKAISKTHQTEMFTKCAGKVKFVFTETVANVTKATITNSHK